MRSFNLFFCGSLDVEEDKEDVKTFGQFRECLRPVPRVFEAFEQMEKDNHSVCWLS